MVSYSSVPVFPPKTVAPHTTPAISLIFPYQSNYITPRDQIRCENYYSYCNFFSTFFWFLINCLPQKTYTTLSDPPTKPSLYCLNSIRAPRFFPNFISGIRLHLFLCFNLKIAPYFFKLIHSSAILPLPRPKLVTTFC